jgi:hypothetical protein
MGARGVDLTLPGLELCLEWARSMVVGLAAVIEYPLVCLRARVTSGQAQVSVAGAMGSVYNGEPGSMGQLMSVVLGHGGSAPWRSGLGVAFSSMTSLVSGGFGPQFQQTALGMAQGPTSVGSPVSGVLPSGLGGAAAIDYLKDWQELKFEREVWRSLDSLGLGRRHWVERQHYYANFYSPSSTVNKISTWVPNHLIPG